MPIQYPFSSNEEYQEWQSKTSAKSNIERKSNNNTEWLNTPMQF
jgi:hypothetical protein